MPSIHQMTSMAQSWRLRLLELRDSRYFRGSMGLAGGVLLAQGIAFAGGTVLARLYVKETQDAYAAFVALVTTVVPIATLRYDVGVVMPEDEEDGADVFRLSVLLALAASVLSVAVVVLGGLFGWQTWSHLGWLPPALLAQAVSASVIGWCNRRHFFAMQTTAKVVQAAAFPLLAGVAWWYGGAVPGHLTAAYALASVLGALIIAYALARTGTAPRLRPGVFVLNRLVAQARRYRLLPLVNLPMYAVNTASLGTLVWSLQYFPSGTSACFMLVMQILRVPVVLLGMSIGQVLTARSARLISQPQQLRRLALRTAMGLTLAGMALAVFFSLFGPWTFTLVYGQGWRQAGEYSQWLSWGAGAGLVTTPFAMLPTLLHSNTGQLVLTVIVALARAAIAWWGVTHSSDSIIVIGASVIDVLGAAAFLAYLAWLLHRAARPPATPDTPMPTHAPA
ncbi:MAG: lipopolysaccharide biosynthesis protein [Verrucomicrobiales bacterium]